VSERTADTEFRGTFYEPPYDAPLAGTPTTVVQLYARKSLLSPSPCDKRP